MTFDQLKYLWYSDLYRHHGRTSIRLGLKTMAVHPGYKYSFFLRLSHYLMEAKPRALSRPVFLLVRALLKRYENKYGISIPPKTRIGSGLYIGHHGGILVNTHAVLGKNCNLNWGVLVGEAFRGNRTGNPVLGDGVFVGPGAKIVGAVRIGNNAAIGANCVVTTDVPDSAVVSAKPGDVIPRLGAKGYVVHTDY